MYSSPHSPPQCVRRGHTLQSCDMLAVCTEVLGGLQIRSSTHPPLHLAQDYAQNLRTRYVALDRRLLQHTWTHAAQLPLRRACLACIRRTPANTHRILYVQFSTLSNPHPDPLHSAYVGDDFPTELPTRLAAVGLVVEDGAPRFSLTADNEWATVYPANDGFTALGPANRTFLVAMVHQMHCLDVLRVGFAMHGAPEYTAHAEHCLRYLRQAILCAADPTLEPSTPRLNKHREWTHAASGEGSVHRCRDWTALGRYLAEHPPGPLDH